MNRNEKWLEWAVELQSLAQTGLAYVKDNYDKERFERIREISAEMISYKTEIPLEKVKDLFCGDTGYQTPKLDTRAAIFEDGKILLVRENDGRWSLPGGWVDVNVSVRENTIKEVREEAGLDVVPERIIAVQDRAKHNLPVYAYGVCKILCSAPPWEVILCPTSKPQNRAASARTSFPSWPGRKTPKSRCGCALQPFGTRTGSRCSTRHEAIQHETSKKETAAGRIIDTTILPPAAAFSVIMRYASTDAFTFPFSSIPPDSEGT